MNHDTNDEQLTRLVAGADPLPEADHTEAVERVWSQLETELRNDEVVVPLRRPRRRVVVAGAVVAAVALTAAAPFIAARTGEWNTPEWISAGGPGEFYRLDGTDFGVELEKLSADIPYPDEAGRSEVLRRMVEDLGGGTEPAEASTGALRADVARGAICAWSRSWQAANTAGDTTARRTSVEALKGALGWTAVTDVDPRPAIDGDVDSGFGLSGPTVFGYLPGIIDTVTAGDAASLDSLLDESAYCVYYDDHPAASPDPAASSGGEQPAPSEASAVETTPPDADPATASR